MDYQDELHVKLLEQSNEIISTLPSFVKKYFYHLRDQNKSPRTSLGYAYDIQHFFRFLESSGGFNGQNIKTCTAADILDKLTIDDIQEYVSSFEFYTTLDKNNKEIKHLSSEASKARRICAVRSFYKYYFKIGEISNDLASKIDVPEVKDKKIITMNKNEIDRLLAVIKNTEGLSPSDKAKRERVMLRDYAIIMLFLGTGIRVSELVGIDIKDIDFYDASITVTRKGGDEDYVFFNDSVEKALDDYEQHSRDLLLGPGSDEQAFFLSTHHKRITVRSVELLVKKYAALAGLNIDLHPHSFRKTYGTHLYEETGDIYLVADALHHSSVDTTRKHYASISKEHKRMAAKATDNLLSPEPEEKPKINKK